VQINVKKFLRLFALKSVKKKLQTGRIINRANVINGFTYQTMLFLVDRPILSGHLLARMRKSIENLALINDTPETSAEIFDLVRVKNEAKRNNHRYARRSRQTRSTWNSKRAAATSHRRANPENPSTNASRWLDRGADPLSAREDLSNPVLDTSDAFSFARERNSRTKCAKHGSGDVRRGTTRCAADVR